MTFEQVKAAATALPPDQRENLINYLVGLDVTEDPKWQETIRASTGRHGDRYRAEMSSPVRVAEGE